MEGVELNKFQRIPTNSQGIPSEDNESFYDSESTTVGSNSDQFYHSNNRQIEMDEEDAYDDEMPINRELRRGPNGYDL